MGTYKQRKMSKYLIAICTLICFQSCEPSGNSLVSILEKGIEQVEKAETPQELSRITYDIKDKMVVIGNLPGGDKKMSEKETKKVIDTQNRFYKAVEKRSKELKNNGTLK